MNNCNCKHKDYCKNNPETCKVKDDPWCKPDGKILGMTTKEIMAKQGRPEKDLKK
jgi:uncharacterized Fe-S cluster protein YjdI